MPDELGARVHAVAQIPVNRVPRIVIAITAGENDDADFHPGKIQFSRI
jgi:hypothetical protein